MAKFVFALTLSLVTAFFSYVTNDFISETYVKLPSAVNTVFNSAVSSVSQAQSPVQCGITCLRHSAKMFTYKKALTSLANCRCHGRLMTPATASVTAEIGTEAYMTLTDWLKTPCAVTTDCPSFATCFYNLCVCPYTAYYSESTKLCIPNCPDNLLGTRFSSYPELGLAYHNFVETYAVNMNASTCQQSCLAATVGVCRSAEWTNAQCYLQDTDLAQTPSAVDPGLEWTYEQRSCL